MQYYAEKHNIPIFYGLPCGHDKLNIPVKCGAKVKIEGGVVVYL
jgi:muramoyltetrapeptide carboxypeptidase LdcA involved in peptidoglycan recycling